MGVSGANGKLCRFEFGRAHADFRIARKAETFTRQEQPQVHFSIGILVMNQGHGISSRFYPGNLDIIGLGRGNL